MPRINRIINDFIQKLCNKNISKITHLVCGLRDTVQMQIQYDQ